MGRKWTYSLMVEAVRYSLFAVTCDGTTKERTESNEMKSSILFTKSKAFALRIVRLYKHLRERKESVIAKQMLRSGTSIGANIAESRYAQSKSDFTAKLQIALKEAAETQYWLELLRDAELVKSDKAFTTLCDDCTELIKILTSSVKTAKAK